LRTWSFVLTAGPTDPAETRQLILITLKRQGPMTIRAMARRLKVSDEAVRQHVVQLLEQGWIEPCKPRRAPRKISGRPPLRYCLTLAGDHLFPKHYDALAIELLETIDRDFGERALLEVFAAMADDTVAEWKSAVEGRPLRERIEIVRRKYAELDRATIVQRSDEGYRIIERNCPFLNVAMKRPPLCSVAVNVLTRLLGCKVVRVERFQNGDGRCVFRVFPRESSRLKRFALEPPIQAS
jgi:predicted ArsR family transcriptional regulator